MCALFFLSSFLKPYTLNTSEATFPPLKFSSQRKRKRKKMTIQTTVSSLLGVSAPNEEEYLFLNTAAAAKAQS